MAKFYLKNKKELKKIIEEYTGNEFGIEDFDVKVNTYPCVLVCSYSYDVDFGDYYQFETVSLTDFQKKPKTHFNQKFNLKT